MTVKLSRDYSALAHVGVPMAIAMLLKYTSNSDKVMCDLAIAIPTTTALVRGSNPRLISHAERGTSQRRIAPTDAPDARAGTSTGGSPLYRPRSRAIAAAPSDAMAATGPPSTCQHVGVQAP